MKFLILLFSGLIILNACSNEQPSVEIVGVCGTGSSKEETKDDERTMPSVFKAKCAVCHQLDRDATGPKLRGVLEKIPHEKWLEEFVRNEDSLVQLNDEYTLEISKWSVVYGNHNYKSINKVEMEQIKNFLRN